MMYIWYQERTMTILDIDEETARIRADTARVRNVLNRIADKWTVMILTLLCPRTARFNELKRMLHGITHKALADALKRLERTGLITRTVLPTTPVGVVYAITPLGHSLREPFAALCDWALKHGDAVEKAEAAYGKTKGPEGKM